MDKLKERFKSLKAEQYVICGLEFIFSVALIYFAIAFSINLARGIIFFGENLHTYEILVTIVFYVLGVLVFVLFVYDLFFKDYSLEKNVKQKVIRDGKVYEIDDKE